MFQRRAWIGGNVCQEVSELWVHWNRVRCYKVRSTIGDVVFTSCLIMIFVILFLHDQFHDWMKLFECEKLPIKLKWSLQLCHVVLCLLGQWYSFSKYCVKTLVPSESQESVRLVVDSSNFCNNGIKRKTPPTGPIPFAQPVVLFWSQESLYQMYRCLNLKAFNS